MRQSNLIEAINEAERFLSRAKLARECYRVVHSAWDKLDASESPALLAATRRSSLDLSKALSKLRREP